MRTATLSWVLVAACFGLVCVDPSRADDARPAGAPKITSASFETRPTSRGLEKEARALASSSKGPVWAGYAVAAVDGRHRMCCWDSVSEATVSRDCCGRCRLEKDHGFSISSDHDGKVSLESSGRLFVLFRAGESGVGKIRVFSEDCEIDTGRLPFVWLTGVGVDESLDWLATFVTGRDQKGDDHEDLTEQALAAIAMHAGGAADRLLERFVSAGRPFSVRGHAAFWMGVARGRAGYDVLSRLTRDDPDEEMRKKAIFALSQTDVPEAVDAIIRAARGDSRSDVRGEALFWLAQKAGEKAAGVIARAIEDDPETEVKKKAVFALSQLPDDEGVPLLIDVARKNRNPAVRKEAVFWLGQSGDRRALAFIEEILRS